MSKNITIAEGAQSKNFNNVAKIRTNLIGGGTQNWIPEDEAGNYANLEEIYISENGTYYADDEGVDGFSKVSVNVSGGEAKLITKEITANGTYNASADAADGYSEVYVNIGETGREPVSSGGDGNEYFVETDPNTKNFIKTVLPSSIEITTSPTKRNYVSGETIDITGMVVKAYKNDGTIWTATGYSSGIIPNTELIIEPNIATIVADNPRRTTGSGLNVLKITYTEQMVKSHTVGTEYYLRAVANVILGTYKNENHPEWGHDGRPATIGHEYDTSGVGDEFYITQYNDKIYLYGIGKNVRTTVCYNDLETNFWDYEYSSTASAPANRWEHANIESRFQSFDNIPTSLILPINADMSALHSEGMMVNVKWKRPKDNKTLTALLPLKVSAP